MATHHPALDVEQLGYPGKGIRRQESPQRPARTVSATSSTPAAVTLMTDRRHTSLAPRASVSVSAAVTLGSIGLPACRRSSQAVKVAGVTSSSGFRTTTLG